MKKTHFVLAAVLAYGLARETAADLITPISQTRTIAAGAGANFDTLSDTDSDSDAATDFGLFNSSVSASASVAVNFSSAAASQDSNILSNQILGTGTASSSACCGDTMGSASASSSSRLRVTFSIDRTLSYTYNGELDGEFLTGDFSNFSGELSLTGPSGSVIDEMFDELSDPVSIMQSGTLEPGQYTIIADVFSFSPEGPTSAGEASSATFDFDLNLVPEPSGIWLLAIAALSAIGSARRYGS